MGLLDIFDGADFSDPKTQGLLNFGLALMGSQNRNLGQSIGQAGLAGLQGYAGAQQQQSAKKRQDLQDTVLQMQVDQQKQALAKQKAFQDAYAAAQAPQAKPDFGATVASPVEDKQYGQVIGAGPMVNLEQPKQQPQGMQLPADLQAAVKAYQASGDPVGAMKLISDYKATLPKYNAQNILGKDAQGNLVQYSVNDQGQAVALPFMPAEKLDKVNLGNRVVTMGEYTGQPKGQMAIGLSPDAAASNAVAWANNRIAQGNLDIARANQGKPQVIQTEQGVFAVDPRLAQAAPVTMQGQQIGKGPAVGAKDARDALAILDQAEPLIKQATGSFLGRGVDLGAQAFGMSTSGANAAAQLKALEGALVSKMPKMSGPQSDKDVAMYRQMAGNIGDPTVPADQKLAAIQTIRDIQNRYAGTQPAPQQNQSKLKPYNDSDLRNTALKYGVSVEQAKKMLEGL